MVGNRIDLTSEEMVRPFIKMVEDACVRTSVQTVFEAMRMFGYVNEQQYSVLNTTWVRMTTPSHARNDGAETIELARKPMTGGKLGHPREEAVEIQKPGKPRWNDSEKVFEP